MANLFKIDNADAVGVHLQRYLETDGAVGHHADFSGVAGPADATCLLLKTKGRRTGDWKIAPLIYGADGGNFVIIASLAGAPNHPAWYLNLEADPKVRFQVGSKKYEGRARVAQGAERARLWAMMATLYSPYDDYQARTSRVIPVIVLEPTAEVSEI
jgi:deazaflavin-dependent oxidoreductase (nitroreductase family)